MSRWYYTRDGKRREGPVTVDELQALVKDGRLLPADMLLEEGSAKWVPVSSVLDRTTAQSEKDPYATRASLALALQNAPASAQRPGAAPIAPGARFRILREHAKGGLGQVYLARDEELHREVALKGIQNRYADEDPPATSTASGRPCALMLLGGLRSVVRLGKQPRPRDLAQRIVDDFLDGAATPR